MQNNILNLIKFVLEHPTTGIVLEFYDCGVMARLNFYDEDGTWEDPYLRKFEELGIKWDRVILKEGQLDHTSYFVPIEIAQVPPIPKGEKEVLKFFFYLVKNAKKIEKNFEFAGAFFPGQDHGHFTFKTFLDLVMEKSEKKAFVKAHKFLAKLKVKFPQLQESQTIVVLDLEKMGTEVSQLSLL